MTQQSNGSGLIVQGRIVWGSGNLFSGSHLKDERTKQPLYNQDGSPKIQYGFGLAIPKMGPDGQWHPEFLKVWNTLNAEALTLFPGGNIPPTFAMKFKDGDKDVDHRGELYSKREGYAGHIVLSCTTFLTIKWFRFEGGNNIMVNDGVKVGDYVNVQLNVKAHPAVGQGKAGLYVNPSAVQLIQAGKEIINTPSGDQLFGMAAPVYQGQVEAPVAPTMPMSAPGPSMPQQPAYAPPVAAPAAQPHYGVVPPSHQPAPTPAAAPGGMPSMPPMPGQR